MTAKITLRYILLAFMVIAGKLSYTLCIKHEMLRYFSSLFSLCLIRLIHKLQGGHNIDKRRCGYCGKKLLFVDSNRLCCGLWTTEMHETTYWGEVMNPWVTIHQNGKNIFLANFSSCKYFRPILPLTQPIKIKLPHYTWRHVTAMTKQPLFWYSMGHL